MSSDSAKDLTSPLEWIERLSSQELKDWLRVVFLVRTPYPLSVPANSRLALELADVLRKGSPALKARIRAIMPELLQEWGRYDPSNALDDMLVLSGKLRCAAAEAAIMLIVKERLSFRDDEVDLRQRCLSVLSGFGCTDRSTFLFKSYIEDVDYSAICFRALYRFDLTYAASQLPLICNIFRDADATSHLRILLTVLFRDLGKPSQVFEVLNRMMMMAEPDGLKNVLQMLRGVGLLTSELFLKTNHLQRSTFFKLFLSRISPDSLREALWEFKSIGVELHLTESLYGQEYLHAVYQTANTSSVEDLFETEGFSDYLIATLIEGNEKVALAWAEAPEGWALN